MSHYDFDNQTILSPQAQIVLLIILLVAIVNVFVGTFIPATDNQKAQGIFNYNGTLPTSNKACLHYIKTF